MSRATTRRDSMISSCEKWKKNENENENKTQDRAGKNKKRYRIKIKSFMKFYAFSSTRERSEEGLSKENLFLLSFSFEKFTLKNSLDYFSFHLLLCC